MDTFLVYFIFSVKLFVCSVACELVNDIAFNMQKGHQNDVVVMDFAKAFDKLLTTDCFTNCHLMGLWKYLGLDRFFSLRKIAESCP